ncbi:hypothetical protein E2542_SST09280 [Spatholobus suberectus]|nr:hypothetical protein E2542_SST09280 [Spatholobus suberectus]
MPGLKAQDVPKDRLTHKYKKRTCCPKSPKTPREKALQNKNHIRPSPSYIIKMQQQRSVIYKEQKQIRPEREQGRKRSRIDDATFKEKTKPALDLPGPRPRTPLHKELILFLEEEQRASEAGLSANEDQKQEEKEEKLDNMNDMNNLE